MAHTTITSVINTNGQSTGSIDVDYTETAISLNITATITATLQRSLDSGATWVNVQAYTTSAVFNVKGPGLYRVTASGVTGGSCTVQFLRGRQR